jgi:hypothetical protein
MKILTMPDTHAYSGMRNIISRNTRFLSASSQEVLS